MQVDPLNRTPWFSPDGHTWRGTADTGGSFTNITSSAATANTAVIFAVEHEWRPQQEVERTRPKLSPENRESA